MVDLTLPDASPAQDGGDAARRLAERVVAWQHRHPLARRIGPGEVAGWGVIALPYGEAGPDGRPSPLFHQPSLLPGLPHRALVDFAARHAVDTRPGPADWPQRDIERADASAEPAPATRYLLTAAITEPRSAVPRRLLVAPAGPAIWGARPPARARLALAGLLGLLVLALAAGGLVRLQRSAGGTAEVVAAPAGVASVASATRAAPSTPAPVAASAVATAASASAVASVPPVVALPASAAATAAPRSSAAASAVAVPAAAAVPLAKASAAVQPASAPAPVPPPRLLPMPAVRDASAARAASSPLAASAPGPQPMATGPHYALVSAPTRKRADAEATLKRVRQLLGPAIGSLQAQVMPSPQGFVVTLWPLPTQADAEHLADVLGRRGVPMKWLEF